MATTFEILCTVVAVTLALYYYLTSTFNFWKERGVAGPRPYPLVGNIGKTIIGKISMGDYLKELYDKPEFKNEPLIGIFTRRTPILIVKDPELIKDVLIKDFSKISDRGITVFEKVLIHTHTHTYCSAQIIVYEMIHGIVTIKSPN